MQEKTNITTFFLKTQIENNNKFNAGSNNFDKRVKQHLKELASSFVASEEICSIQQVLKTIFDNEVDIKQLSITGLEAIKTMIFKEPAEIMQVLNGVSVLAVHTIQVLVVTQPADLTKEKIHEFYRLAALGSQPAKRFLFLLIESLADIPLPFQPLVKTYLWLLYSKLQELTMLNQSLSFVSVLYELATYLQVDAENNPIKIDFFGLMDAMSSVISAFACSRSNAEDLIMLENIVTAGVLDMSYLFNTIKVEDERINAKKQLLSICEKAGEVVSQIERSGDIQIDIQQDLEKLREDKSVANNHFYAEKIIKKLIVMIALRDGYDELATLFAQKYLVTFDRNLVIDIVNTQAMKIEFYKKNILWLVSIAEKYVAIGCLLCKYHLAEESSLSSIIHNLSDALYYFTSDVPWAISYLKKIIKSQNAFYSKKAFVLLANKYFYQYSHGLLMNVEYVNAVFIRETGEYCQKMGDANGYYEHLLIAVRVYFDQLQLKAIDPKYFVNLQVDFLAAYERASSVEKPQLAQHMAGLYFNSGLYSFEEQLSEPVRRDMVFWALISIMQGCTSLRNVDVVTYILYEYQNRHAKILAIEDISNQWSELKKQGNTQAQKAILEKDKNPYLKIDKQLLMATIMAIVPFMTKKELEFFERIEQEQADKPQLNTLRMSV